MISKVKGKTEISRQPPGRHPAALCVAGIPGTPSLILKTVKILRMWINYE